jgi:hypothetical protein
MIRRISPKQRKRLSTWAKVSAERLKQTGGQCEACYTRTATSRCHHKRLKSQGGKDELSNAMAVCWICHDWIHKYPKTAELNGWIITRKGDRYGS